MKAGRNEPCPCGSGKKYKKCCLGNDEQIIRDEVAKNLYHHEPEVDEWEPEEDSPQKKNQDWFEEEDFEEEDFEEEEDVDAKEKQDIFGSPIGDSSETDDNDKTSELPEISDEEMKLVDDWWEKYKKMNDTVEEREHLQSFINLYPHLVDYLELQHEVLFEMGGGHFRKGIYDEFVELLLKIRKEYPRTYKESFKYYDSDLIYWYTAQGRLDEIDMFFDYFREKQQYSEQFDNLIDFFLAINRSDILLASFADTKIREYISWIISNNIMQNYLENPIIDESIQSMFDELAKEGVLEENATIENLKELLLDYTRPFTIWSNILPKKRSQVSRFYYKIYRNFTYFLYKNTELSFNSAHVFSYFVYEYYRRIVEQKKRPADIFCLDEKSILTHSLQCHNTMFWGCTMQSFMALNAFYWFADYLKICGNISEEQKNSVQEMLTKVYQEVYKVSKNQGPEMLSFVQFPLWTIK